MSQTYAIFIANDGLSGDAVSQSDGTVEGTFRTGGIGNAEESTESSEGEDVLMNDPDSNIEEAENTGCNLMGGLGEWMILLLILTV